MASKLSLFAYGSLTEGFVHYGKISNYVTHAQPASLTGFLYQLEVGYPVLLQEDVKKDLNRSPQLVNGTLLDLEGPDLVFKLLDEFHGYNALAVEKSLYFKRELTVETESGESVRAQVYCLNPKKLPKGAIYIEDGDWRGALASRPPLTQLLDEKHAAYIKKLGASTGREIVPIDLALYRELMKMDLIVDKGRRLALTKLGKEVFRYLE